MASRHASHAVICVLRTLVTSALHAVVGAISEASAATGIAGNQADNSAPMAGAAYVFTRNGTSWSQRAYVKASNSDAGDQFGDAVALSGDASTIAVGAVTEAVEAQHATGVARIDRRSCTLLRLGHEVSYGRPLSCIRTEVLGGDHRER
ncbi:MAG: Integrin alpha beta-propellor repeat protein [Myxococcales bacterium]|nr:Integrin alpha beta-propellor repeat protein [Myxococcales bacterium]